MLVLTSVTGHRIRVNPLYVRCYEPEVVTVDDAEVVHTSIDMGEGRSREIVKEPPNKIDALLRVMGASIFHISPDDGEPRRFASQGVKAGQRPKPRAQAGGRK